MTPGLIDNHNHILLLGNRVGRQTPIETAASFADVTAAYLKRAKTVASTEFITSIGGFNPVQFAEKRLPTLAELDAIAVNNPIYMQVGFSGPSTTNTAGKAFLESKGVAVGADGSIAANVPTIAALNALRSIQSFSDRTRGTTEALQYAASLGITANYDMGGFVLPGLPGHADVGEFAADGAASWDPATAYDPILALQKAGTMASRVRIFFLSMDTAAATPVLEERVQNSFKNFGDDWLRVGGLGEFISNWPLFGTVTPPPNYPQAIAVAAQKGWIYQQHTLTTAEDEVAINAWETLNQTTPIASLHWSLAHVKTITAPNLARLKAMGAGVAAHGYSYLAGTAQNAGPPYRTIIDSGIQAGAGSDAAQISTLNPWLMIYYMVTGKNSSGQLINPNQLTTRQEALQMYTNANSWFTGEEKKLGSIEVDKLADLVVLSDDYFAVTDENIKQLHSSLTIVGGKIVHSDGTVVAATTP